MKIEMNLSDFESQILRDLSSDIKLMSHTVSSNLAHKISDELAQEYQYVIDRFYSEYDPEHYVRHSERGMVPGLNKTFKKYYKNPHNTIYYGGIEITSDNMYNDYRDSKEKVLSSFLNGYHGRPSAGIESSLLPYRHMLKFREHLVNEIGRPNSVLFSYAKNKATSLPYKIISIK